ncbi:hypothetical protein AB1Y20_005675 [Prymnesium parvum]|uniref:Uncharacterized protein n=1 Tax=Prymnesium parvum TaxID=97485 RepID=A0AB34J4X3_PRYPA
MAPLTRGSELRCPSGGSALTWASPAPLLTPRGEGQVRWGGGVSLAMPPTAGGVVVQRGHVLCVPGGLVLVETSSHEAEAVVRDKEEAVARDQDEAVARDAVEAVVRDEQKPVLRDAEEAVGATVAPAALSGAAHKAKEEEEWVLL